MRYHELALQAWFYSTFFVAEGYPVPMVFASPMDAFSAFDNLWKNQKDNPFAYLTELKDENGNPLYEPYPSNVRYPLISVYRRGWKYRTEQNFSIHNRTMSWPVVDGSRTLSNVTKNDLAYVTTAKRPMAWNFSWQVDHYCLRPDTQAFFVESLMREMSRAGGVPQTWIPVSYPGWGRHLVRLYIDGDIESATPEQPEEGKIVEYKTTFQLVLEGYSVDTNFQIVPALWKIVMGNGTPSIADLEAALIASQTTDLRANIENPNFNERTNLPPSA